MRRVRSLRTGAGLGQTAEWSVRPCRADERRRLLLLRRHLPQARRSVAAYVDVVLPLARRRVERPVPDPGAVGPARVGTAGGRVERPLDERRVSGAAAAEPLRVEVSGPGPPSVRPAPDRTPRRVSTQPSAFSPRPGLPFSARGKASCPPPLRRLPSPTSWLRSLAPSPLESRSRGGDRGDGGSAKGPRRPTRPYQDQKPSHRRPLPRGEWRRVQNDTRTPTGGPSVSGGRLEGTTTGGVPHPLDTRPAHDWFSSVTFCLLPTCPFHSWDVAFGS